MTDIVWGAEIPIVDGKKPEWLRDDDRIAFNEGCSWYGCDSGGVDSGVEWMGSEWGGLGRVHVIRLPANHPYYATAAWQPDPRTVQACAEHIANLPVCVKFGCTAKAIADELIEALLPAPVDPDLIEARRIAAEHDDNKGYQYLDGSRDEYPSFRAILAALKCGRELEREK